MMGSAIVEVLPLAIGVALSPLPIAAVIVMLFTPQGRTNAATFLAGWVLGLLGVGAVVFVIPGLETGAGDPTALAGVVRGAVGLLLVAMGWRQWRSRSASGEPGKMPAWMARADQLGVGRAAGMGVLFVSANPKNLLLTAAAAATIDESRLALSQQAAALLVFVALASATVAFPLIGVLVAGQRAEQVLARGKDWLIMNNARLIAVLLLLFGVLLVSRAIKILGS
jgi:hypothetical protein